MAKKVYIEKGSNNDDLLDRVVRLRERELAVKLLDNSGEKKEKKDEKRDEHKNKISPFQTWALLLLITPISGPAVAGIWKMSYIMLQRILQ